METDIYTRLPSDLNYKKYIETSDDVEIILSQIRMILGTNLGEVLGNPNFGFNIKLYLFALNYNQEEIERKLLLHLSTNMVYDPDKWQVTIKVNFGKDYESRTDYAIIDIYINLKKCEGILVNLQ